MPASELIADRIPWVRFERFLEEGLYPALQETVRAGGRAAGPHLAEAIDRRIVVKQIEFRPEFSLRNPQAERFAAEEAAELVRQIVLETRLAIRALILEAQRQGLSIPDQARQIRQYIGLTERQTMAVQHYAERLAAQGLSADVIKQRTQRYYEKLVRYRAQLIARTETIRAANRGQQALWEQAISEGYLSPQRMKTWIVTPDDRLCELCRTMDGQSVPVTQMFNTPLGFKMSPDLHPGCRCAMGLEAT